MTEHEPRPIDLTSQANPNRLGVRGNIFMADGTTNGPEQNPQGLHGNTPAKKPDIRGAVIREGLRRTVFGKASPEVSFEAQERSRAAWEEFYKGKKMLPGEQAIVERIIRSGGMPRVTQTEMPSIAQASGGGGGERPPVPPASPSSGRDEDEGQTRQRNESHRAREASTYDSINVDGLTNPQILNRVNAINSLIEQTGDVDLGFLNTTLQELARFTGNDVPLSQRNSAMSRIASLIESKKEEVMGLTQGQREQRLEEDITGETGYHLEQILTDRKKRDEVFNDLFAGVDSTPHEFFERAFNPLTHGLRYERFMDLMRNASIGKVHITINGKPVSGEDLNRIQQELKSDFDRYQAERRVRQSLHDVNAILYLPSIKAEQLFEHMQQFSSELGDMAWKMTGIKQMMDVYEACLRENMAKNNGYLVPDAVLGKVAKEIATGGKEAITEVKKGDVEENAKKRFREMMRLGLIARRDIDGNAEVIPDFKDWEIDRIFTISRGMMIMSERLISLAAESRLPKGFAQNSSLFLQDVIQSYAPYVHLLGKFGVTEAGLAAYLYSEDNLRKSLGILKRWNPKALKDTYDIFTGSEDEGKGHQKILYDSETMRYLMRPNANRAGDIFTWVSWRILDNPELVSMVQEFLSQGKDKMPGRVDARRIYREKLAARLEPDETLKPESTDDFQKEYVNWIGTAIRLEKLRGGLEKLKSTTPKEREKGKKDEETAKEIIKQMVRFQPHRLYLVSPDIRTRIQNSVSGLSQDQALNDLSLVETAMLRDRERLLNQGITFSDLKLDGTLPEFKSYFDEVFSIRDAQGNMVRDENGNIKINEERLNNAMAFMQAVKQDFHDKEQSYYNEFITNREYKHGFVLWSGDAPVDEYNASAEGPTGAFARRARDNDNQVKAFQEEIKMLISLRELKTPEQAIKALGAIYDKISIYDPGKAKQATAEKAKGVALFFAADTLTNVPALGQILELTGNASMAQFVYGKTAGVWHPGEIRYFFTELKNRGLISQDNFNQIQKEAYATRLDVALNFSSALAQLLMIAGILYMSQKLYKPK